MATVVPIRRRRGAQQGMTLLEMMIVLAIIAGIIVITAVGVRRLTKGELVDDAMALAARMRQASSMALESGVPHRVTLDLAAGAYVIERCEGRARMIRARDQEELAERLDPEAAAEALEEARSRMGDVSADLVTSSTMEASAAVASAIAGHHVGDQQCVPATDGPPPAAAEAQAQAAAAVEAAIAGGPGSGAPPGLLGGQLDREAGTKVRSVHVQHLDEAATAGVVSIYFFPDGSAEKAIVNVTDGDAVFPVLVAGLTGRVEVRDEALRDPDEFMLRNPLGDREAER
ncbi:MAG: prepilin-type N-terminal cleavage/methylation domain-containing protein [Kofleriaceae bacterium]